MGRRELLEMIWSDSLDRKRYPDVARPVVAVFGPRGSGKTSILGELVSRAELQASQPFVSVLNLENLDSGMQSWQLVGKLAYALTSARWTQFGRLKFPRFALGRLITEGKVTTKSPEETQSAIEDILVQARRIGERRDDLAGLVGQLPQLLGLPSLLGAGTVIARAIPSKWLVASLYRTGIEFYRTALRKPPGGGFQALVELREWGQSPRQHGDDLARVLCEAFLADLAANYAHGFRPRNCLVLLDNIDVAVGQRFMSALQAARARRAGRADPLVVVVTSRRIDLSHPSLTTSAESDYVAMWATIPADGSASFADWAARQAGSPHSAVYPVRLTDLSLEHVGHIAAQHFSRGSENIARLVFSLTRGHPWSVAKVLAAYGRLERVSGDLAEPDLRRLFALRCEGDPAGFADLAAKALLLDDLSRVRSQDVVTWAAARDVATGEDCLPATRGIQAQVAALGWLSRGEGHGDAAGAPVLNAWLRRLLLHKLSQLADGRVSWLDTFARLARHAMDDGRLSTDEHYYLLAAGQFSGATGYLNDQFDRLDAEGWIETFNLVTSAPRPSGSPNGVVPAPPRSAQDAQTAHGMLTAELIAEVPPSSELPDSDQHGERWVTIAGMVVARWLWSDPLSDPALRLNPVICNGFRDLARRSPRGGLRLVAEADFYHQDGRP
ncbi:hypothetical protein [Solihabitans fulvus]|nr:hypothetical protein [Solihabitans fulvus]